MQTRDYLQSLYPFYGSNRLFFLFLFYLLFGRFIEAVRYAMPYVYSGLIFFITLKTQRAVKELHLEKDDKSEIILKTYSKA